MDISVPKENYIFIELTGEDMKNLNITYADMDYSNIETRRVIRTLLDEAKHSLGQEFELSEDMRIEALPSADGGCLLFFSIIRKPTCYKIKSKTSFTAYRFKNIDSVLDLSFALSQRDKTKLKSSLYTDKDEYIMTLIGKLRHSVTMKLCEYAEPVAHGESEILKMIEYKTCLIKDNALDRLCFVS